MSAEQIQLFKQLIKSLEPQMVNPLTPRMREILNQLITLSEQVR